MFGELITLIEVTKREGMTEQQIVTLPYTKEPFSVPANVSIIGTMNTADRSIALMDTALRRRFDFVEAMPDPTLLEGLDVEGVDVARMLSAMNDRIELLYDREHTLGHAYLMDLRDDPTVEHLRDASRDRIIPLLQEYFFDDYGKIRSVLGAAADDFIERRDASGVFWDGDAGQYDVTESYRLRETPASPEAYARIYQSGIGAQMLGPDPITIREFEYLTATRTGRGDCRRVSPEQFAALREFVLSNREGDSQLELMRLCAPPRIGEAIQATNYVGVIQLRDGLQIEVLPKIDFSPDSMNPAGMPCKSARHGWDGQSCRRHPKRDVGGARDGVRGLPAGRGEGG